MGRFDELSDLDFEELVADLMSADLDLQFRAGTRGRDAGVDILAVEESGREHVVQCKHYRVSSFSTLHAAAKKEAGRLNGLSPDFASYRFVTSRRLNHQQRDEIAKTLSPWVSSSNNVYGEGDLRRLLRDHSEVEAHHVKLWLAGAGPLQHLLNAAAFERSGALLEETKDSLPRFVQTKALAEAREILHNESVCVIAGTAGVGKTTLARLLMLDGLEEGFQPYEISPGGLKDAWELLSIEEPQLFYFDDFLGQTALHESRHHDAELLRLMRKVAREPRRRFVLATREYILRQAKQLSEALDRESEDAHRFLLTIDRYSRQEKARIFYNHIYFSDDVDETARKSLLTERSYLRIIDHPNYSPRLIEWFTGWSGHELSEDEKENYAQYCISVLDDPEQLWSHAFEQGLADAEQALLIALLGLPRQVHEDDAERAFRAACKTRSIDLGRQRFLKALSVIEDSFVTSDGGQGQVHLSFINPSVIDFLRSYLSASRPDAELAIRSASFFEQVDWLWNALAGDEGAPSDELAKPLGEAFGRTLRVDAPKGSDWRLTRLSRNQWGYTGNGLVASRLNQVLEYLAAMPRMGEVVRAWLPSEAEHWLETIKKADESVDTATPKLVVELADLGVITLERSAEVVKDQIKRMGSELERWESLDALHGKVPEVFSETEWADAQGEFAEYLEYVIDEPNAYLTNTEDLGTLEDLAFSFEAPLDGDQIDQARHEMEEAEDAGYEPDEGYFDDEGHGGADFGESDQDIDAMFDRLA